MRKEPYKIPDWKLTYIRVNHAEMTATELSKLLDISDSKIYNYCKEIGIKPKRSPWYKDVRPAGHVVKGHSNGGKRYPKHTVKTQRPPAVYSNQNTLEKYL